MGNAPNSAAKGVLPRQFICAQRDARSVEEGIEGFNLGLDGQCHVIMRMSKRTEEEVWHFRCGLPREPRSDMLL